MREGHQWSVYMANFLRTICLHFAVSFAISMTFFLGISKKSRIFARQISRSRVIEFYIWWHTWILGIFSFKLGFLWKLEKKRKMVNWKEKRIQYKGRYERYYINGSLFFILMERQEQVYLRCSFFIREFKWVSWYESLLSELRSSYSVLNTKQTRVTWGRVG